MRKIHSLGLVGATALVLAAVVAPAANGATRVETEQFSGKAQSQALDLHLLGRQLTFGVASTDSAANKVDGTLNTVAKGIGTLLSDKSTIVAGQGSDGGRACFELPLVGDLLGGAGLPVIKADLACGEASSSGDVTKFTSTGVGEVANIRLTAAEILQPVLGALDPVLSTVLGDEGLLGNTPVGELLASTDETAKGAIESINGVLGDLLGEGALVLPAIEPTQTVENLVKGLANGDLLNVDIGDAVATNVADADRFTSEAIAEAGSIEVLPAFGGAGLPPLLKITMGESAAAVNYDQASTNGVGSTKNTIVRVESQLLPQLGLGQLGVAGAKPLETLVKDLGLNSGPGFIELSPGKSVSIFCGGSGDLIGEAVGALGALCTEISVGMPKETKLPDGGLRVESAAVNVHLFKGLNNLVPGVNLGSILGEADIEALLAPVTSLTGVGLGNKSDVPGIKLGLAQTIAEARGTKVLGNVEERQRALAPAPAPPPAEAIEAPQALPRTGGLPLTAAIPALLGTSAGLRWFLRRRNAA